MNRIFLLSFFLIFLACSSSQKSFSPKESYSNFQIDAKGWENIYAQANWVNVNCSPNTWFWKEGVIFGDGKGKRNGMLRFHKPLKNFELLITWRHLSYGGNSGIFVWGDIGIIDRFQRKNKAGYAKGIEVQILDHGFKIDWEKKHKRRAGFTTQGDIFPIKGAKMNYKRNGKTYSGRSKPTKKFTKGSPNWNQYHIKAINGKVQLWVNGKKVNEGFNCQPNFGYLCLEAEGAPIEFKNIYLKEVK